MKITLAPNGTEIPCEPHNTIMDAVHWNSNVPMASICGGKGLCGKCIVQILDGKVTPPTEQEGKFLDRHKLAKGFRLACECYPRTDLIIHIDEDSSFATPYKVALPLPTEEMERYPNVLKFTIQLQKPTLEDPTPDLQRVLQGLRKKGVLISNVSPHFLPYLPQLLRGASWEVTAVIVGYTLSFIEPGDTSEHNYGIAFDLGTTTVAAYLLDMSSGRMLAQASETNRQIGFGADVLTRIDRAHEGDLYFMQQAALTSLNNLIVEVTHAASILPANIYEAVIVGNTCMHHILLGIDPYQAGISPFTPFLNNSLDLRADDVGIQVGSGGNLYLLPLVSGFVGADLIAGVIALDLDQETESHLLIDIGTNAEMALATKGRILVCAAAAGPAFEGARIGCGMRAGPGAIDRVRIVNDRLICRTIDNLPAAGVAGSGLISAAAALKRAGLLNKRGGVKTGKIPDTWLAPDKDGIVLASAQESKSGNPIVLTWRDIGQELVIAIAAIRTGLQILLKEAGLQVGQLRQISIAGAFGNYLDFEEAREIGLIPDLPLDRIYAAGNAAGNGAVQALLSHFQRKRAEDCISIIRYIELSTYQDFNTMFAGNMTL